MPCTKELVLLMKSPRQMGLILEVSHRCRDLQLARTCTRVHAPFFFFYSPPPPPPVKCGPSQPVTPFTHSFHSPPISLSLSLVYSFYPSSSSLALVFYSYKDLVEASRLSGQNKPATCPPPHLPKPCLTTTTNHTSASPRASLPSPCAFFSCLFFFFFIIFL